MERIGFVGLGHMGLPMAINLVRTGFRVIGFDLQDSPLKKLTAAGGTAALNLQEAASGQDLVFTMLQTADQVQQCCQNLFTFMSPQSLFIDCSTIDVDTTKTIQRQAIESKIFCLDAPVSGGVTGATAANLTFMVGGSEQIFNKARPILAAMGKKIIYTGAAGSGQAAKICNNMILAISMLAISEAFILAKSLGLSAQKLFEVVTNSSGQCWAMNKYVPAPGILPQVPANNDYKPGFTCAMMLKDLRLSQDAACKMNVHTPTAALATTLYQQHSELGASELDFSSIIKMLEPQFHQ